MQAFVALYPLPRYKHTQMQHLNTISFPHDLSGFSEIIDVRSPAEFALDHIPGAINLPVLDDTQRAEVGTLYKQNPFNARRLGAAQLSENVAQHLKNHLADKDIDYIPLLYCWRGGMRSRSFTLILKSIGWKSHVIKGGYRAFRQSVVDDTKQFLETPTLDLRVLSGLTGVGKTRLLIALRAEGGQIIDLEGLANHKGSLLGASPSSGQPTQKCFESRLWDELRQLDFNKPIYIEAESNRIGNVHCPSPLWAALREAKVLNVELPVDERIILLREDYPHFQDDPETLTSLLDILVRLRGQKQVDQWLKLVAENDWDGFVGSILTHHYDLCYRQPGDEKSNYQPCTQELQVKSASEESYQAAARELLARG